jgi:hypothetical protein
VHFSLFFLVTTGKEQAARSTGTVGRTADNQAEMHASGAPGIDNTIAEQWTLTSEAAEPCNDRRAPRPQRLARSGSASMRNRKPGAVSRPGATLEFQFHKYTDLRKGVNNIKAPLAPSVAVFRLQDRPRAAALSSASIP